MTKARIAVVCFVWLIILGCGAMAWKWIVTPAREQAAIEADEAAKEDRLAQTSTSSRYKHHVDFALDSFSGYAVFRSQEFQNELSKKRIRLTLIDDGANYTKRIQALETGEVQLAVFTIDALIKASDDIGSLPATIVAIVDETRGADAMVAYKDVIPNVDALNQSDTKFVLTPNSPSEMLVRVVMSHFNLDNLGENPFIEATDAEDVYKKYRNSKPDEQKVYVLWEPYVTKLLENPNIHVVIDSSRFHGYIVDVIVANRDYLLKNQDVVSDFIKAYLRTVYYYRDSMIQLTIDDAREQGMPLTKTQAENLVKGVWWKNTQENYAHMGLHQGKTLQHVEDAIINITDVLLETQGIDTNPTDGNPNLLYFDGILARLQEENFHPGLDVENIRNQIADLPSLTEEQWESLIPVGTLEVPPLVFARGTPKLSERSQSILKNLIEKLKTWPQYYVLVRGNASLKGNLEANKKLAQSRAKEAEQYLIQHGVKKSRVRAVGVEPSGFTSVQFVLGEMPY